MLANLRALFGVIVDIILLRRGPEQLPASPTLLAALVAASIVQSSLAAFFTPVSFLSALLQTIVGAAILLLWFHAALKIAGKRERFTQMMSALFGVDLLFVPVILPLIGALLPYAGKTDPQNPPPAMLSLVFLGVGVWWLFVKIRIVKATFEMPAFAAFLLLAGEFFATILIFTLLFGAAPAQG
jgi:uncharacterized membrane protein